MLTRDNSNASAVLQNIEHKCEEVVKVSFTKDTAPFDIGYIQAHRDMLTRIKHWKQK